MDHNEDHSTLQRSAIALQDYFIVQSVPVGVAPTHLAANLLVSVACNNRGDVGNQRRPFLLLLSCS